MPSYSCSDFHLENPWMLHPPLILALPTLILNSIVVQLVLIKKEFDHLFYRLLCVFSMSSCCFWYFVVLSKSVMSTEFACHFFYDFLLKYDRLILLLTVPWVFFYLSLHHAALLLALNRATTAINPIAAKKFWQNNEKKIMLVSFVLVFCQSIPYCFNYTDTDPEIGMWDKSSTEIDPMIHKVVFDIITIILLLVIVVITIYTKVVNNELAKYANERNMLHTGLVLAVITGVVATIEVIKFFLFIRGPLGNDILEWTRLFPIYFGNGSSASRSCLKISEIEKDH